MKSIVVLAIKLNCCISHIWHVLYWMYYDFRPTGDGIGHMRARMVDLGGSVHMGQTCRKNKVQKSSSWYEPFEMLRTADNMVLFESVMIVNPKLWSLTTRKSMNFWPYRVKKCQLCEISQEPLQGPLPALVSHGFTPAEREPFDELDMDLPPCCASAACNISNWSARNMLKIGRFHPDSWAVFSQFFRHHGWKFVTGLVCSLQVRSLWRRGWGLPFVRVSSCKFVDIYQCPQLFFWLKNILTYQEWTRLCQQPGPHFVDVRCGLPTSSCRPGATVEEPYWAASARVAVIGCCSAPKPKRPWTQSARALKPWSPKQMTSVRSAGGSLQGIPGRQRRIHPGKSPIGETIAATEANAMGSRLRSESAARAYTLLKAFNSLRPQRSMPLLKLMAEGNRAWGVPADHVHLWSRKTSTLIYKHRAFEVHFKSNRSSAPCSQGHSQLIQTFVWNRTTTVPTLKHMILAYPH